MKTYNIKFKGRKAGAIGTFYPCAISADLLDPKDAQEVFKAIHKAGFEPLPTGYVAKLKGESA